MRKIPFAVIELTSQRVRGLRGTSELPGRPEVPDFFFCSIVPVQQTTSGIGHRVKYFFRVGNQYCRLNVRNNDLHGDLGYRRLTQGVEDNLGIYGSSGISYGALSRGCYKAYLVTLTDIYSFFVFLVNAGP